MAVTFGGRLKHAWNALTNKDPDYRNPFTNAQYGFSPSRSRSLGTSDKSILTAIYNRIAVDVASVPIYHIKMDSDGGIVDIVKSGLNYCLSEEANVDQGAMAFRLDVVLSLFEHGVIAIVPVDTTLNPNATGAYDIQSMRVGRVVTWEPRHVWVEVYNDRTGNREEIRLPKSVVAIVENPFYNVMNEPNSTLQRLIRKLSLLDSLDEQISSGKLDLIIQLPYVIKTETKRAEAEKRRKDIEMQLSGSKYGIAYTDGTERITQLNRPAENHMLKQVEYLTELLYNHLGITKEVFDGTAPENVMINYNNRTIDVILTSIVEATKRSFLTKTARTQGHSITFYRDPFKLVPVSSMSDIADKFIRNTIMTPNEIRKAIGMRPIKAPGADTLSNPNMPVDKQDTQPLPPSPEGEDPQNGRT